MRSLLCATVFALTLVACGEQELTGTTTERVSAPVEAPPEKLVVEEAADGIPPVAAAARKKLAEALGVSEEKVVLLETRSVVWPNSARGCPDPDKVYAQVITPGWFIRLAVGSSEYQFNAGESGEPFACDLDRAQQPIDAGSTTRAEAREHLGRIPGERVPEETSPAPTGEVPEAVMERLIADASARSHVDADAMVVLRAESLVFSDGSLGCPKPDVVYTQAPVPGYRVVLRAGEQTLDYRITERGTLVLCGQHVPVLPPTSDAPASR
jgi:hypothetical protein